MLDTTLVKFKSSVISKHTQISDFYVFIMQTTLCYYYYKLQDSNQSVVSPLHPTRPHPTPPKKKQKRRRRQGNEDKSQNGPVTFTGESIPQRAMSNGLGFRNAK